jgi:hypothetical protein
MVMNELSRKQNDFLKRYEDLLKEVDDAVRYAGECCIQGDEDIADRLLASVSSGLLPYHPENVTLVSIFKEEKKCMNVLQTFYETVQRAAALEEKTIESADRMHLVYEEYLPQLEKWRACVKSAGESRGSNYARH